MWRNGHNDRRVLYSAGYAAAMMRARADLCAQHASHVRDFGALQQQIEELRREVAELRALAVLRDPTTRLN